MILAVLGTSVLAFASPAPWEMDWPVEADWYSLTTDRDQFWVVAKDVKRSAEGRAVTLWMRGSHQNNPRVPYRSSLWKLQFSCQGLVTVLASTTITADGESQQWDGYQTSAIRPETIYESLEEKYCTSG